MIKLLGNVPRKIAIAVSGGPDSMAALDFLSKGKREILALYFNHGTVHAKDAEHLVADYCSSRDIPYVVGNISRSKYKKESQEEYWRNERYRFFESLDGPVITAHHLDDVVEWWTFTSFHGTKP